MHFKTVAIVANALIKLQGGPKSKQRSFLHIFANY